MKCLFAVSILAAVLGAGCASPPKPYLITTVSPGIYSGRKPERPADFDQLEARGVRTVLSLEWLPWDILPERRHTQKRGMAYCNVPILASPLAPREKRVKAALLILRDPARRPIFIHCYAGEDRNALIVGLYRIYYEGWTPEAAWEAMRRSGFHSRWSLRGFTSYFWKHTQIPEWVKKAGPNADGDLTKAGPRPVVLDSVRSTCLSSPP